MCCFLCAEIYTRNTYRQYLWQAGPVYSKEQQSVIVDILPEVDSIKLPPLFLFQCMFADALQVFSHLT